MGSALMVHLYIRQYITFLIMKGVCNKNMLFNATSILQIDFIDYAVYFFLVYFYNKGIYKGKS